MAYSAPEATVEEEGKLAMLTGNSNCCISTPGKQIILAFPHCLQIVTYLFRPGSEPCYVWLSAESAHLRRLAPSSLRLHRVVAGPMADPITSCLAHARYFDRNPAELRH